MGVSLIQVASASTIKVYILGAGRHVTCALQKPVFKDLTHPLDVSTLA